MARLSSRSPVRRQLFYGGPATGDDGWAPSPSHGSPCAPADLSGTAPLTPKGIGRVTYDVLTSPPSCSSTHPISFSHFRGDDVTSRLADTPELASRAHQNDVSVSCRSDVTSGVRLGSILLGRRHSSAGAGAGTPAATARLSHADKKQSVHNVAERSVSFAPGDLSLTQIPRYSGAKTSGDKSTANYYHHTEPPSGGLGGTEMDAMASPLALEEASVYANVVTRSPFDQSPFNLWLQPPDCTLVEWSAESRQRQLQRKQLHTKRRLYSMQVKDARLRERFRELQLKRQMMHNDDGGESESHQAGIDAVNSSSRVVASVPDEAPVSRRPAPYHVPRRHGQNAAQKSNYVTSQVMKRGATAASQTALQERNQLFDVIKTHAAPTGTPRRSRFDRLGCVILPETTVKDGRHLTLC